MRMKSIVGWYTRNKNVPGPPFIYYCEVTGKYAYYFDPTNFDQ